MLRSTITPIPIITAILITQIIIIAHHRHQADHSVRVAAALAADSRELTDHREAAVAVAAADKLNDKNVLTKI